MRPKLLVNLAYVEWGSGHRKSSLHETLKCISMAGADIDELVIVDNKLDCDPFDLPVARRIKVLAGDNRAREFSAWDVAHAALELPVRANLLLFVNDTFGAHRRIRLVRRVRVARWSRIAAASPRPELFGATDQIEGEPIPWTFGTVGTYVSSYMFGMNNDAARILFPLCAAEDMIEPLLAEAYSPAGLFTNRLPKKLRDHVSHWLLTPGHWRNAEPLSEANFNFFRLKAKSILYEFALTSRATSAGIGVSDIFEGTHQVDRLIGYVFAKWVEYASLHRLRLTLRFGR